MSAHTATRHAPLDLWRIAEAFLRTLHAVFGAPEDIAAQYTLTRAAHKLISSWLNCGEALLRRLLLIEAAAYEAAAPLQRNPKSLHPRTRRLVSFNADEPETWRVSFRSMYRRLPAGSSEAAARSSAICRLEAGGTSRFASAWPLAERFEAMLRVFNDPVTYAKRLARRVRAQPQCVKAVLRAPPEYMRRVDRAETLTHAAERAAAHNSS